MSFLFAWARLAVIATGSIALLAFVFGDYCSRLYSLGEHSSALYGIALFVLRWREPTLARPFRVPLYPLLPLAFCASSAWLLYSSLAYTRLGALVGVGVLAAGVPLLALAARRR